MTQNPHNDLTLDIVKRFSSYFVKCRPRCRNIKFILMVSIKKIVVKRKCIIFDPKNDASSYDWIDSGDNHFASSK